MPPRSPRNANVNPNRPPAGGPPVTKLRPPEAENAGVFQVPDTEEIHLTPEEVDEAMNAPREEKPAEDGDSEPEPPPPPPAPWLARKPDDERGVDEQAPSTAIEKHAPPPPPPPPPQRAITATMQRISDRFRVADAMYQSNLFKQFDSPQAIHVAIGFGEALGFTPEQAVQNLDVIEGTVRLKGRAAMALIQRHPEFVSWEEVYEGDPKTQSRTFTATCTRRGLRQGEMRTQVITRSFSLKEAHEAGLWPAMKWSKAAGKLVPNPRGPWDCYPDRMLFWRVVGQVASDQWGDVMSGLTLAEEFVGVNLAAQDAPNPNTTTPGASFSARLKAAQDAKGTE